MLLLCCCILIIQSPRAVIRTRRVVTKEIIKVYDEFAVCNTPYKFAQPGLHALGHETKVSVAHFGFILRPINSF